MYNGFYICPKSKKDWFIWSLWLCLFVFLCYCSVLFFLYFTKFYNIEFPISDLYRLDFLPVVIDSHFGFWSVISFLVFFEFVLLSFYLFFNKIYLSKKNKIFFLNKLNKQQSIDNKIAWKNYLKNFDKNT